MPDKLDRILDKLDVLDNRHDALDKTLTVNTLQLAEHIKRTNLLEERFKPVEEHVVFIRKLIQFILTVGALAAAVTAISHFL